MQELNKTKHVVDYDIERHSSTISIQPSEETLKSTREERKDLEVHATAILFG